MVLTMTNPKEVYEKNFTNRKGLSRASSSGATIFRFLERKVSYQPIASAITSSNSSVFTGFARNLLPPI